MFLSTTSWLGLLVVIPLALGMFVSARFRDWVTGLAEQTEVNTRVIGRRVVATG